MAEPFSLNGSEPSSRKVAFSEVERPHGDELTFFVVHIVGERLDASCSIESLGGDSGFDVESEQSTPGGGSTMEPLRLSKLLVDLGSGPLWSGERCWRSLAGELEVALSVDDLGHVDVRVQISPRPWNPPWSASCTLRYSLGDLSRRGSDLGHWFDEAIK